MADISDIDKGEVRFILMDDAGYVVEFFESEDELEEYLEEGYFDEDEIEEFRVFEVKKEYEVVDDPNYTLQEV